MTPSGFDLPLDDTPSSRFLALIVGGLVYLAVVAFAVAFAAHQLSERAAQRTESLTLSMSAENADRADRLRRMIALSEGYAGVLEVSPLSEGEIRAILSEWFAQDPEALASELLPDVLDVEIADGEAFDLEGFERAARAIEPSLTLDASMLASDPGLGVAPQLRAVAALAGASLLIAGVGVIVIVTRMSLDLHDETVDLLQLMGAADLYVAKQFQRHALMSAARGAIAGYAAAWLTLLGFAAGGALMGEDFGLALRLGPFEWMALACIPILFTIFTTGGARLTALWCLGRMR